MPKKAEIEVIEDLQELKKYRSQQSTRTNLRRIEALIAIKTNEVSTRQELADYMHAGKRTVERWLTIYKNEGIEGLVEIKPRRTGSKYITMEIHNALEKRVTSPTNSFKGYWDAHAWVQQKFDSSISYQRLRGYMIKHFSTKLKRPRKSHIKKDEGSVALFKNDRTET